MARPERGKPAPDSALGEEFSAFARVLASET